MIWAIRGAAAGRAHPGRRAGIGRGRYTATTTTPRPAPVTAPTVAPTLVLPPASQPIVSRIARETSTPVVRATPSGIPEVAIVDYGYAPAQLSIKAGQVVRWVDRGDEGHDVTGNGPGGAWRSGPTGPGRGVSTPVRAAGRISVRVQRASRDARASSWFSPQLFLDKARGEQKNCHTGNECSGKSRARARLHTICNSVMACDNG